MAVSEVAYLGPEGTYSHLVAEKCFGSTPCRMRPLPTILDVCRHVSGKPSRRGVIPIENSSGGAIYETVDILLAGAPPVTIREELTLDVKLALLGRRGEPIKTLYSHFAPLEHCVTWLEKHLPGVERRVVASTAVAAQRVCSERNSGALGSRKLARVYNLDVLEYPVEADVPNITVFLAIGGNQAPPGRRRKTTLAVKLINQPGALCSFLDSFRKESVNLSRIISRPIRGCPREYAFLVDIDGGTETPKVSRALEAAGRTAAELRMVGSYASHRPYKS